MCMVWKLNENTMELIIDVIDGLMQVCAPSSSRVHCIFSQKSNKNDSII